MAMNLASKYSQKVDERFKLKSLTAAAINKDYDWTGVDTIYVYGVDTAAMNDYTKTGNARYGTAAELGNTKQSMILTKDRSFTFTIDRANKLNTQMTMDAGKALARQIDEVIVPEIDAYRLAVMATAAVAAGNTTGLAAAITASNAYIKFLAAQEKADDNKVPQVGRICFVKPSYYNFLKLDSSFIKASDIAQKMLINGQVGEVDGVKIIKVPSSYLPAATDFILTHPSATVGAEKLEDYKTHDNPPGINGWLVEGRNIYDAFVLENKKNAIVVHKNA
ncbi:MAG: N4-gp56 family major capsid protein [Clostridiales bacterium]|nr:N4-gp56 family major capsid protein [Clostridiales bacterium]